MTRAFFDIKQKATYFKITISSTGRLTAKNNMANVGNGMTDYYFELTPSRIEKDVKTASHLRLNNLLHNTLAPIMPQGIQALRDEIQKSEWTSLVLNQFLLFWV